MGYILAVLGGACLGFIAGLIVFKKNAVSIQAAVDVAKTDVSVVENAAAEVKKSVQ